MDAAGEMRPCGAAERVPGLALIGTRGGHLECAGDGGAAGLAGTADHLAHDSVVGGADGGDDLRSAADMQAVGQRAFRKCERGHGKRGTK